MEFVQFSSSPAVGTAYIVEFPAEEEDTMAPISLQQKEENLLAYNFLTGLVLRKRKQPLAICAVADCSGEDEVVPKRHRITIDSKATIADSATHYATSTYSVTKIWLRRWARPCPHPLNDLYKLELSWFWLRPRPIGSLRTY